MQWADWTFAENTCEDIIWVNSKSHALITNLVPSDRSEPDLPTMELSRFNKSLKQYYNFINDFENSTESRISSTDSNYCVWLTAVVDEQRGLLKDALCRRLFGGLQGRKYYWNNNPDSLSEFLKNLIDSTIFEARHVKEDVRAMSETVIKMQNCDIALEHLGCGSWLGAYIGKHYRIFAILFWSYWAGEEEAKSGVTSGPTLRPKQIT